MLLLQSQLFPKLSNNVHANVCARDSERGEKGGWGGGTGKEGFGEGGGGGGVKIRTDGIRE